MLQGFPLTFNIYANNEREVSDLRFIITEFIRLNAEEGIAISADKLAAAMRDMNNNPIIKNRIKRYFDGK